jgi:hypothetical protein
MISCEKAPRNVKEMLERLIEMRETVDASRSHERFDIENRLEKRWKPSDIALLPILETISPSPHLGKPLRECVLAIIWEVTPRRNFLPFPEPKDFVVLLSSAACYQLTSPGVSTPRLFPGIIR